MKSEIFVTFFPCPLIREKKKAKSYVQEWKTCPLIGVFANYLSANWRANYQNLTCDLPGKWILTRGVRQLESLLYYFISVSTNKTIF